MYLSNVSIIGNNIYVQLKQDHRITLRREVNECSRRGTHAATMTAAAAELTPNRKKIRANQCVYGPHDGFIICLSQSRVFHLKHLIVSHYV